MTSLKILPLGLLLALTACGDSGGTPTTDTNPDTDPTTGSSTAEPATDTTDTTLTPTSGDPPTTDTTGPAETTGDTTLPPETTGDTTAATDTGPVAGDCDFDDAVEYSRTGTIWQLQSADGETCVWLERHDDSEPDVIYKAVPYTLLGLRAGHMGTVESFTDPAGLSWESTHHNWTDVIEAWDPAVRYTLADQYTIDFTDQFDLTAVDEQSKAVLWGPVRLYPYVP